MLVNRPRMTSQSKYVAGGLCCGGARWMVRSRRAVVAARHVRVARGLEPAQVPGDRVGLGPTLGRPEERRVKVAFIGQKGLPATLRRRRASRRRAGGAGRGSRPPGLCLNRPHYNPSAPAEYRGVSVVTLPSVATKHLDAITHVAVCTRTPCATTPTSSTTTGSDPRCCRGSRRRGVGALATVHGRDWQRRSGRRRQPRAARRRVDVGARPTRPCRVAVAGERAVGPLRSTRPLHPNGIVLESGDDLSILGELDVAPGGYVLFASRLVPEKGAH